MVWTDFWDARILIPFNQLLKCHHATLQIVGGALSPQSSEKMRALREAAINQSLDHPNCVRTYHFDIRLVQAPMVSASHGRMVMGAFKGGRREG